MKIISIKEVKNPHISVVVPTLNEERYIEKCLSSLRRQDFDGRYEIIVSDGYSQDKTLDIAKKYADKIVLTRKKGAGAGRTSGAKVSKGKILVFIDADTVVPNNLLSKCFDLFKDERVIGATCYVLLDDKRYWLGGRVVNNLNRLLLRLKVGILPGICTIIRREVFFKVGGYNEDIWPCEDVNFSFKLRKVEGKLAQLRDVKVFTSARRAKANGLLRSLWMWPFGYYLARLVGKEIQYDVVR